MVLTCHEPGQGGNAGAGSGGGEQGMRAVALQRYRTGGEKGLEPLRILQNLEERRICQKLPLADVVELSDADALAANQMPGRIEGDGRASDANRNHARLRRPRWL